MLVSFNEELKENCLTLRFQHFKVSFNEELKDFNVGAPDGVYTGMYPLMRN